jgi:hypothetical protein
VHPRSTTTVISNHQYEGNEDEYWVTNHDILLFTVLLLLAIDLYPTTTVSVFAESYLSNTTSVWGEEDNEQVVE